MAKGDRDGFFAIWTRNCKGEWAFYRRERSRAELALPVRANLFPLCSFSVKRLMSKIGRIAGGAITLAGAYTLAMSAVLAADQQPRAAVSAAIPLVPKLAYANANVSDLIGSARELVIGGERLNVGLLRAFYARHGFAPVWPTRQAQANSLKNAVMRAADHGLAPELFHAGLLQSPATLPALEQELLLSDAFLSYADALARGRMPVERRRDDEVLTPEPIDVAAALDAAIASPEPSAAIEALAPTTPTYRRLVQALQSYRAGTPAEGKSVIEVNLERERWLPRRLPPDRVWVNVADERVVLYRDDRPVFSTRVIVGRDERRNQSPEFLATVTGILFNPPWNVPNDIATGEILPKAARDPNYLAQHKMVILPDGGVQQLPGPNSGLGELMLEMNNRFDVYLHDTPSKHLFSRADRRLSHGCIRVENARELAALLMRQPMDAVNRAIAMGSTTRTQLPQSVPVFVVYETAFADVDGSLQYRPDVYGRDGEIAQFLNPERRPFAEARARAQRGG
jgi:L,D-transpeptidase YcbB